MFTLLHFLAFTDSTINNCESWWKESRSFLLPPSKQKLIHRKGRLISRQYHIDRSRMILFHKLSSQPTTGRGIMQQFISSASLTLHPYSSNHLIHTSLCLFCLSKGCIVPTFPIRGVRELFLNSISRSCN